MSTLFEETPQENATSESVEATATTTSEQEEVKQPETTDHNSLFADQLKQIVTPDGRQKYADVSTALGSIPHAQNKINELSEQIKALEEKLQEKSTMAETQQVQSSQNQQTEQPSSGAMDESQLAELVERQLSAREQQAARAANANKVRATLEERYGEAAEARFNEKAAQLGVTSEYLAELAMTAPQLVMEHFGKDAAPTGQPVTGGIRTDGVKPSAPERRSVMFGASSKDVVEQFRAHKPS